MAPLLDLNIEELLKNKIVAWAYTEELTPVSFDRFRAWTTNGHHGPLSYLADERGDKRENISLVYPAAKSSLVFLFDYRGAKQYLESLKPKNKISSYAVGFDDEDYHHWIKRRLIQIGEKLEFQSFEISLDIHPVLERDLAYRAGLGWFGKNSMLLNKDLGSYFLIGSLILPFELDLPQRQQQIDHCGSCTRCIDACPTNAILGSERTVIAEKCISTYTIEVFKEREAPKGYPTKSGEVFGCDICQEVCPWVKKNITEESIEHSWLAEYFNRSLATVIRDIEELSNKGFETKFKGTSLERLGKRGLLKNLKA